MGIAKREEGITRRNFLAGAALGGAGIALASATGCSPQNTSEDDSAAENTTPALETAERTEETDVLVVGLGASGLQAACAAAQVGAQVTAIDIATNMEGTTNISTSGFLCVGDKLQLEQPYAYTVEEMFNFLNETSNYTYNIQTLKAILEASSKSANNFIDAGLPLTVIELPERQELTVAKAGQLCGHPYGTKGAERAAVFTQMIEDNGINALFNTEAKALIIEDGEVRGVQCDSNGTIVDIRAKKTILCTGGFLGSEEMVAQYMAGSYIVPMGNINCVGTGINLAISAGAQIGKSFSISGNEYGGANPMAKPTYSFRPGTGSNEAMRLVLLGGLIVNANGERFFSEEKANKEAMHCMEPFVREKTYYAIVDQAFIDHVYETPLGKLMGDGRMQTMFDGVYAETLYEDIDRAIEEGWVTTADTIEGLAATFNLTNLVQTVEAYNGYCDEGYDPEFYVDASYLRKLSTPPYYAVQSYPAGWVSLGGIKTDAKGHALDSDNKPITNLFVAGADADIFTMPYMAGGSANGFSQASGWLAGESAANEIV